MDVITWAAEFIVASLTDGIVFLNHFRWRPRLEDFVDSVQPPPLQRLLIIMSKLNEQKFLLDSLICNRLVLRTCRSIFSA